MLRLSGSINKTWINGAAKTVHCIWKNKHIADLMTAPQEPLSIDLLVPAGVLICRCTRDHKSCIKQAGPSNNITDLHSKISVNIYATSKFKNTHISITTNE